LEIFAQLVPTCHERDFALLHREFLRN
jgi:hypothetical protein